MSSEHSPPNRPDELEADKRRPADKKRPADSSPLEAMECRQLEEILIDLLTVKYPGIEQDDIDRFFRALDSGKPDQIEQTEADIAEKSALWQRAALDLDAR
jgi:hypothetical protein